MCPNCLDMITELPLIPSIISRPAAYIYIYIYIYI